MTNMAAFGVAMARSASGQASSVPPFVLKNVPTKIAGGELGGLDPAVVRPVLQAMTATAATGDASDLTRAPGLRALVGTNGPEGPGWFIGYRGDQAFAILVSGERSGAGSLQVAGAYLK